MTLLDTRPAVSADRPAALSPTEAGPSARVLDAVLTTGWVAAAAGWLYGAVVAIVVPQRLPEPITAGLRIDTFAILCFAAMIALHLTRGLTRGGDRRQAVLATVWVHALAVAGYLALNTITHPDTLNYPLTHLPIPQPNERQVLIVTAATGLASLCGWLTIRPGSHAR